MVRWISWTLDCGENEGRVKIHENVLIMYTLVSNLIEMHETKNKITKALSWLICKHVTRKSFGDWLGLRTLNTSTSKILFHDRYSQDSSLTEEFLFEPLKEKKLATLEKIFKFIVCTWSSFGDCRLVSKINVRAQKKHKGVSLFIFTESLQKNGLKPVRVKLTT